MRLYLSGKNSDKFAIVDKEDYDKLSQYKWFLHPTGYVRRNLKGGGQILLHREIMNTPEDLFTDHINGNRLDNRKTNLRICTARQNSYNKKSNYPNPLGVRGVSQRYGKRFYVRIKTSQGHKYIGAYDNLIDAARAYDDAARKYHGEFAILNNI